MDFYNVRVAPNKRQGVVKIYPEFIVGRSRDIMVRGKAFYAVWNEAQGLWSTDEYDVVHLIDADLERVHRDLTEKNPGETYVVEYLRDFDNNRWSTFKKFLAQIGDNSKELDGQMTFRNSPSNKSDYATRRVSYDLQEGDYSAWDELISHLYAPEERAKIEWAIGALIVGDAKNIQKFLVFYGPPGTGKSTILNIIERLFEGYASTFDAKALGSQNGSFATEAFRNNPLVAIQHDGDLSRIDDNTKLNSIVSHERIVINEKYKSTYQARIGTMLMIGTNQPVKISDAKSGIIRRLIDVNPTGKTLSFNHYTSLMSKIEFQLGAIAAHCRDVYLEMGKSYYNGYRPVEMMFQTDPFLNFVEAHIDQMKAPNGITLKRAYDLYKIYCEDSGIKPLPQYKVREELRSYFDTFHDKKQIDGVDYYSLFFGFNFNKYKAPPADDVRITIALDSTESLLDTLLADMPAQQAGKSGTPATSWDRVTTTLKDIDTSRVHYVKVPHNHIVVDFDLKDESGNKSLEKNLEAASGWPATYAEYSKSGGGLHLHYLYDGDPNTLASVFSPGVEIKVYKGNSSLRRRLTRCNTTPIATIHDGLPTKEKRVITSQVMQSERSVRDLIARNLNKEIHPGTKSSIDFIKKVLDDAYDSGISYDVTDLRPTILAFANNSSNQALTCLRTVQTMKFKSLVTAPPDTPSLAKDDRLVFFDLEVYPNLLVICWKYEGDATVVRMINPDPHEVEALFSFKLVGYNNRRYDNHILWARYMGYSLEGIYKTSQRLISNERGGAFGEAYGLSYADIYDFSSIKQTLKLFQIQLGLPHIELDLPWDQPVPEEEWGRVADYCANDVESTEATFHARKQDFVARKILADLSGLSVNDTTQKHTAQIIFKGDKDARRDFVYTDLSVEFPGYSFESGKSLYRGEDPGEGGYVYAEPGMYGNVVLLDVASMHPTSIEQLNLFGPYTENYSAIKQARLAIKHKDYDAAGQMLGGALKPYLNDPADAEALSYALKIVINIVYGLTSAKFDNPFRDIRNVDNIVAKRGALFMIDLKHAVQEQGYVVAHIKTDSIKIPNADQKIIDFVMDFGKRYGYEFEHENTYDKFCLVNDAVYVAKNTAYDPPKWTAVGAQFQHPYVYKNLFSKEELTFDDYCETKQVTKGSMWLDFDAVNKPMALSEPGMHFVGRTGRFVPVVDSMGGGLLWRIHEDKKYAVAGTKGYFWLEAPVAKEMGEALEIDTTYFDELLDAAKKTLEKHGDLAWFLW